MRSIIVGMTISALALSSCTTLDTSKVDTAIQTSLPQICKAADTGHAVFVAVAASGKIKESTVNKEALAYSQLQVYCTNASQQTLASTLVAAATAYAVIATALKEAHSVQ